MAYARVNRPVYQMDKEAAKRLYDQGLCDKDIAEECSVAAKTVAKWRRTNNLPPHRKVVKKIRKKSQLAQRAEEAQKAGMTYGQYMETLRGGRRW